MKNHIFLMITPQTFLTCSFVTVAKSQTSGYSQNVCNYVFFPIPNLQASNVILQSKTHLQVKKVPVQKLLLCICWLDFMFVDDI